MTKKPAHLEHRVEDREQLVAEHERLRVEQAQTSDLDTEESRERIKRMGAIDQELAKLDEEAKGGEKGKDEDDDA